jgi:hypothetical protein
MFCRCFLMLLAAVRPARTSLYQPGCSTVAVNRPDGMARLLLLAVTCNSLAKLNLDPTKNDRSRVERSGGSDLQRIAMTLIHIPITNTRLATTAP